MKLASPISTGDSIADNDLFIGWGLARKISWKPVAALGINAIDGDDEATYDSASTIKFSRMDALVGLKPTFRPYGQSSYWQALKASLGTNWSDVIGSANHEPNNPIVSGIYYRLLYC